MRYGLNELTDGKKVLIKSFFSTVPIGKRQYREHHHTECELSVFLSGSGTYVDDGKRLPAKPGDTFYCADGHSHGISCESEEPLEFIALIIKA